ncbi:hypothetical protein HYY69_01040 [Candidatus Woesearchaeota archaeon]|nr:hypothetical protein [Candidatus Woesearchaeota archaeon]
MALDFDVEAEIAADKLHEVTEEGLMNVWYKVGHDGLSHVRHYDGAASHAVGILEELQAPTCLSPSLVKKIVASGKPLSRHLVEREVNLSVFDPEHQIDWDWFMDYQARFHGRRIFPADHTFLLDYLKSIEDHETGELRIEFKQARTRLNLNHDHPQRPTICFDWKEYPGYPPMAYFHELNPWFFGRPVKFFTGDHHIPIVYVPYSLERVEGKIYVRCHMSKGDYMKAAYGDRTVEK